MTRAEYEELYVQLQWVEPKLDELDDACLQWMLERGLIQDYVEFEVKTALDAVEIVWTHNPKRISLRISKEELFDE